MLVSFPNRRKSSGSLRISDVWQSYLSPNCGVRIRAFGILLGGRCRNLWGLHLTRNPLVGVLTRSPSALAAHKFGASLSLVSVLVLILVLVMLAGISLENRWPPNVIVGPEVRCGFYSS